MFYFSFVLFHAVHIDDRGSLLNTARSEEHRCLRMDVYRSSFDEIRTSTAEFSIGCFPHPSILFDNQTFRPAACSTCISSILSPRTASSAATSLSVTRTTLSPNAAAISSRVFCFVSLCCVTPRQPTSHRQTYAPEKTSLVCSGNGRTYGK